MNKLALLFLFLVPTITFSQDVLTYKGNSKIVNLDGERLYTDDIRSIMATNSTALKLFNSGKAKQTWGNFLFYGGIGTLIGKHISVMNKSKDNAFENNARKSDNILYYVAGGVILVAIPIKIGFSKKIKKSVDLINEDLRNPVTGFTVNSSSFLINSNGIGVSVTF